jgi:hypothetical protein
VDDIIDLGEYLRRREETEKAPRTAFAVWGGDGERARFALPLWRIVYLAGGARGGLVWARATEERPARLNPFVVLDLAEDPARTRFQPQAVHGLEVGTAPTMRALAADGSLAIHLGEHEGRRWFLVVDETSKDSSLDGRVRDDILFLSGECAGLLFFRGFANEAGEPT